MKFELKFRNNTGSDEEFLDDLIIAARKLGTEYLGMRDYDEVGKFSSATIGKRFGSWNEALEKAGLGINNYRNVTNEEMFKNIEEVWIKLGRQPLYKDLNQNISKYSMSAYVRRFGSLRKALEAFVEFINSVPDANEENLIEENIVESANKTEIIYKHKTKRQPSERLKVQVLMRDGNKCRLCGITVTGENIHFDHIKPWSRGGETVLENMQVLCALHNLAKGDIELSNDY